jgi:hypothetical protein
LNPVLPYGILVTQCWDGIPDGLCSIATEVQIVLLCSHSGGYRESWGCREMKLQDFLHLESRLTRGVGGMSHVVEAALEPPDDT